MDAAQIAALVGALGAVLVLLPRDRFLPVVGLALLGVGTAGLARFLVGDDDLELLLTEREGIALIGVGTVAVVLGAIPLVRYPEVVPVALLAVAPFRIPDRARRRGGVPASAALPRARRVGARARVPDASPS